MSNTGNATIIARADGSPKSAVYVRTRGTLAGERHALIAVEPGDLVVDADHHRYDFEIMVDQIVSINGKEAETRTLYTYSRGEWDKKPPAGVLRAVEAAREKAQCYHCREPHYIAKS